MKKLQLVCLVLTLALACGRSESQQGDVQHADEAEVLGEVEPDGLDKTEADAAVTPDDDTPDATGDAQPEPEEAVINDADTHETETQEGQTINCAALPTVSGTCGVQAGSEAIALRGVVLAPGATYVGGEVLITLGGTIGCVGCDCSSHPDRAGATVVTCPAGVISPGLINAHDHLTFDQNKPGDWGDERYEHRHQWRKGKGGHTKISVPGSATKENTTWAEMRQVMLGTTAMAGSGKANGFLRNLDKEGLDGGSAPVNYETFPLGDSDGEMLESGCGYPGIKGKDELTKAACYHMHVAEGINAEARNEFLCLSSDANGGTDLVEANTAIVHAIGLKAPDGAELAASGTAVVWSPRSNVSLYGNTAPIPMYVHQGVLVTLGTDWTASGSVNIVRELVCVDNLNQHYFGGALTDRDLWKLVTSNAAHALKIDTLVGRLEPGLLADVAVFDGQAAANPYRAIIEAGPGDVVLVMKAGVALYGDSSVLAALPESQTGCEEIPQGVCGSPKSICCEREAQFSFAELEAGNQDAYGLFFCGVPDGEPSCVPMRPDEYSGAFGGQDTDGDGVVNDQDNCPLVFNPVRPVDDGEQADQDGDGAGDLCDPCPLDANTTTCKVYDPEDSDGDGHKNAVDNCPNKANPLQEDQDQDGKGDLCDPCPTAPNPGSEGCPSTIQAIRDVNHPDHPAVGSSVSVKSVVVTALNKNGFWVQDPDAASFAALYVYQKTAPTVQRWQLVTVSGTYEEYNLSNQDDDTVTELTSPTVTVEDAATTHVIAPKLVPIATIATGAGAASWEPLQAMLLKIEGVTVAAAADNYKEVALEGDLSLDDFAFDYTADASIVLAPGTTYASITGILHHSFKACKFLPRDKDDFVK
jgi:cytosine/adenosine deaminase-related metal-dependent hydrolase